MYKVLIVDDEWMIRENMKKVISWESLGIGEVLTAASGAEALALVEKEMPEIMVTDISMSQMSGLELIETIHTAAPKTRILVLTGYDRFDYARECLRLQVQDFLLKPIDEEVLSDSIRRQVAWLKEQEEHRLRQRTEGIASQLELEAALIHLVHGEEREASLHVIEERLHSHKDLRLAVVLMQLWIDRTLNEQDWVLLYQQIYNICLGVVDAKGLGITSADDKEGRILLSIYADKCDPEEVAASIQDILKDEYDSAPKAAIGNEVAGFGQLERSYQDAVCLLQNGGEDITPILKTESIIERSRIFQEVYEEIKNGLCANVGDYAYVMRVFDTFCAMTESYNLSGAYVRRTCIELLSDISYTYLAAGGIVPKGGLENLMQAVQGASNEECLELGRQYLTNLLDKEEEDIHEIVAKAKQYINQNLGSDLSVGTIAENLFVSPNYFSRLFKRVTGQGCNEYIVTKRMKKACILLETTNFNTGKIAGMVGYNDTNYFSMAFKKHCGVSPTHYRSRLREEKREDEA